MIWSPEKGHIKTSYQLRNYVKETKRAESILISFLSRVSASIVPARMIDIENITVLPEDSARNWGLTSPKVEIHPKLMNITQIAKPPKIKKTLSPELTATRSGFQNSAKTNSSPRPPNYKKDKNQQLFQLCSQAITRDSRNSKKKEKSMKKVRTARLWSSTGMKNFSTTLKSAKPAIFSNISRNSIKKSHTTKQSLSK